MTTTAPTIPSAGDPREPRRRSALEAGIRLPPAKIQDEVVLMSKKWFDYRFMPPLQASQLFAADYVDAYRHAWECGFDFEEAAEKRALPQGGILERYHQALRKLSDGPGLIGLIFTKPQSKITDPAKLRLLIRMIDAENWSSLGVDVKGGVYEGLLAKNADDVRGGAGQYFTPRPVIRGVVDVMRPDPMTTIADPAWIPIGSLRVPEVAIRRPEGSRPPQDEGTSRY